MAQRWSDEQLNELHQEFHQHVKRFEEHLITEADERQQQQELHTAVFRRADPVLGQPPGLLQLTAQINERLAAMEARDSKRLSFVGGIIFATSALWVFVTDTGHKLASLAQKLF